MKSVLLQSMTRPHCQYHSSVDQGSHNTVIPGIFNYSNFPKVQEKERNGNVPCLPLVTGFSSKIVFNLTEHPTLFCEFVMHILNFEMYYIIISIMFSIIFII